MKYINIIIIMTIGLLSTTAVFGQHPIRKQLKAQKIAFITERLALTTAESEKFWPIYNQREKELTNLRGQLKKAEKLKSLDQMTDKEIEALIEQKFKLEENRTKLNRKYFKKMKQVIPMKKIAMLSMAERQWKRQLIRRVKKRKQK